MAGLIRSGVHKIAEYISSIANRLFKQSPPSEIPISLPFPGEFKCTFAPDTFAHLLFPIYRQPCIPVIEKRHPNARTYFIKFHDSLINHPQLIVCLSKHQNHISQPNERKFIRSAIVFPPITIKIPGGDPFAPEIRVPALRITHKRHCFHRGSSFRRIGKDKLFIHRI